MVPGKYYCLEFMWKITETELGRCSGVHHLLPYIFPGQVRQALTSVYAFGCGWEFWIPYKVWGSV